MKFGVCCQYDKIAEVKAAGYDYFEPSFQNIVKFTEEEFLNAKAEVEKNNFPAEAMNGFFPGDYKLYELDDQFFADYCEKGFSRAAQLGCKVTVIGSGKARKVPEGYSKEDALKRFSEILRICGDVALKYDINIVIEPLNTGETNIVNTVADGLELQKLCNHPNVGCLADFFHVHKSGEGLDTVAQHGAELGHIHLARRNDDRRIPSCEEAVDMEDCALIAKTLKDSGYDKRMTLEGGFHPDFSTSIKNVWPILDMFK